MSYKEELEQRLNQGYEELATLELGSTEYTRAAVALKTLQEAYNGIVRSENARYAVDARSAQNKEVTLADMKMRALELGTKTIFKGFWNSRWWNIETDGVVKTLGARNRMNDTNKW